MAIVFNSYQYLTSATYSTLLDTINADSPEFRYRSSMAEYEAYNNSRREKYDREDYWYGIINRLLLFTILALLATIPFLI